MNLLMVCILILFIWVFFVKNNNALSYGPVFKQIDMKQIYVETRSNAALDTVLVNCDCLNL